MSSGDGGGKGDATSCELALARLASSNDPDCSTGTEGALRDAWRACSRPELVDGVKIAIPSVGLAGVERAALTVTP